MKIYSREKKQASDEEVSMYINCLETLTCLFQNVLISIKPQTNKVKTSVFYVLNVN